MDNACGSLTAGQPLSPPSPPRSLDLFGKRRQVVKVQVLEREIGLLQDELKSVEELEPASRHCKELHDFVGGKQDPFIMAISQKTCKSKSFWKRFWGKLCCKLPCCYICCMDHPQPQNCCCTCRVSSKSKRPGRCCSSTSTCRNCCKFTSCFPCVGCGCCCCCCCFKSPICKCKKINLCSNFSKCCSSTCCR